MGRLILEHEGTLERFTGEGMMVFLNDPVEVPNAAERAIRMAVAMRAVVAGLAERSQARVGARARSRHRPGLCDHRRHRVRGGD
jgi:class 3 adenylate cyclase